MIIKPQLSPRQLQIIRLIARELTNREIADEVGVSKHTVKNHITAIFTKLNCRSRAGAVNIFFCR